MVEISSVCAVLHHIRAVTCELTSCLSVMIFSLANLNLSYRKRRGTNSYWTVLVLSLNIPKTSIQRPT